MSPAPIRHALMAAVLLAAALPAGATIVYRMTAGHCNDSNHNMIEAPGQPGFGVGPKLCADEIFVELRLRDTYVPGTAFSIDLWAGRPNDVLESFYFSDAYSQYFEPFDPANVFRGAVSGILPVAGGSGELHVNWMDTQRFDAYADGTWSYGSPFLSGPAWCGIGSIEGPYPIGVCKPAAEYGSIGTYAGWTQPMPEPGALTLVALGATALALSRPRRRVAQPGTGG